MKSKRKRPGEFSEPAWAAVSPSASRNAWCTRWVAVWAREIARRRSTSISACAVVADRDLADADRPRCTTRPGDRLLHVADLDLGAAPERITPWSASWPPPSA